MIVTVVSLPVKSYRLFPVTANALSASGLEPAVIDLVNETLVFMSPPCRQPEETAGNAVEDGLDFRELIRIWDQVRGGGFFFSSSYEEWSFEEGFFAAVTTQWLVEFATLPNSQMGNSLN